LSGLKIVDARIMEKLLFRLGFQKARQKGSHAFYRHPDGRTTTIPRHGSRVLAKPLIREILREIKLTVEQYSEQIENI